MILYDLFIIRLRLFGLPCTQLNASLQTSSGTDTMGHGGNGGFKGGRRWGRRPPIDSEFFPEAAFFRVNGI